MQGSPSVGTDDAGTVIFKANSGDGTWQCPASVLKGLPSASPLAWDKICRGRDDSGPITIPFCTHRMALIQAEVLDYQQNVVQGLCRALSVVNGVMSSAAAEAKKFSPLEVQPKQLLPALVLSQAQATAQPKALATRAPLTPARVIHLAWLGFADVLAMEVADAFLSTWNLMQTVSGYHVLLRSKRITAGFVGFWWDEKEMAYRSTDYLQDAVWTGNAAVPDTESWEEMPRPVDLLFLLADRIKFLEDLQPFLQRRSMEYPEFGQCMEYLRRLQRGKRLSYTLAAAVFRQLRVGTGTEQRGQNLAMSLDPDD